MGRLLQSPSKGRRLAREPGGASEDIRAGASGEKPRGVRLGECATFRSGLRCEADGEVWGELDLGGEGPSTFCCPPPRHPDLSLAHPGWNRHGRGGVLGSLCTPALWNSLSTLPWMTPDSGLWLGRAYADPFLLPPPSPGRPYPQSWGWGNFISPLASGWPGQRQLCLLLSGLPGCDKRQMGL